MDNLSVIRMRYKQIYLIFFHEQNSHACNVLLVTIETKL